MLIRFVSFTESGFTTYSLIESIVKSNRRRRDTCVILAKMVVYQYLWCITSNPNGPRLNLKIAYIFFNRVIITILV